MTMDIRLEWYHKKKHRKKHLNTNFDKLNENKKTLQKKWKEKRWSLTSSELNIEWWKLKEYIYIYI
jgi:hypothetical protein